MSKTNSNKKAAWRGFVDVPVPADSMSDFLTTDWSDDELIERASNLVYDGYKLSFGMNPQTAAVTCSVTCQYAGGPNAGFTMTAEGPGLMEALAFATWKHIEVSNGGWIAVKTAKDTMYR